MPNLGVPKNLKLLENVIGKVIVPLPLLFNEKSPPWLSYEFSRCQIIASWGYRVRCSKSTAICRFVIF
ncbi:hypothetical protein [Veillonella sp. CAG:933]|uniref:hypothetical protein n=1 Tax=Veillonella sp. CAG:933 TaxID=1262980 RepID=UPI00263F78A4|nr:hypothetical protein [Veillonella sp. CAG:933]